MVGSSTDDKEQRRRMGSTDVSRCIVYFDILQLIALFSEPVRGYPPARPDLDSSPTLE